MASATSTSSATDDQPTSSISSYQEQVVYEVTRTFSKPSPDRQRLFEAVRAVIGGRVTIKEAAIAHHLPTSTMHPYVHRARARLGMISTTSHARTAANAKKRQRNSGNNHSRRSAQQHLTSMVRSSAIQHHRRSFGDSHAIDLSCKSSSEQTAADEKPASSTAASSVVRRTGALLPSAGTSGGGSLKQHPTAATAASYDHSNIEQAVERVIKASHYHGADKHRLYMAVLQTVRCELPLTQAAASHSIPFSTLHPYVKKVRGQLGIGEQHQSNDDGIDAFRTTISTKKRSSTSSRKRTASAIVGYGSNLFLSNAGGDHRRPHQHKRPKRQPCPGYQPFKQIEIPQSWKERPQAMQEAVWSAVQGCQYDDPMKKERLCSAVMEALSGTKTMKAAAATHEVPFTTLQTYFHRSRAQLARLFGEESPPATTTPPPRTSNGHNQRSMVTLDSVVGKLTAIAQQSSATSADHSPPTPPPPPPAEIITETAEVMDKMDDEQQSTTPASTPAVSLVATGSNRRKPKKVVRLPGAAASSSTPDPPRSFKNTSTNAPVDNNNSSTTAANQQLFMNQLLAMAAAQVVRQQNTSDPDEIVKVEPTAPEDDPMMWDGQQEMDNSTDPDGGYDLFAGGASASHLKSFDSDDDDDSIVALEKKAQLSAEAAVDRVIGSSHYEGENRQRLKWALVDALDGSISLKESAREYMIPLSTLNVYYTRARNIVRPIDGVEKSIERRKNGWSAANAGMPLDPDDAERVALIEDAVDTVCRSSLYPTEQKERLRAAVMLVIKGQMTINAAANLKQLPSSTVHPYVHRARSALGSHLPPQATGPTPWPSTSGAGGSSSSKKKDFISGIGIDRSDSSNAASPAPSDSSNGEPKKLMIVEHNHKTSSIKEQQTHVSSSSSSSASAGALDLDEVRQTIAELVNKMSLYDDAGRQKLNEAVLMVIIDNATAVEAARIYQLPTSTIQPYVQRARCILGLNSTSSRHSSPHQFGAGASTSLSSTADRNIVGDKKRRRRSAPKSTRSSDHHQPAHVHTDEDVRTVVEQVLANCNAQASRREKLQNAVIAAVSGKSTIKDACTSQGLPASTVHPYISKARHMLDSKYASSATTIATVTPLAVVKSTSDDSISCSSNQPSPVPSSTNTGYDEDNNNTTLSEKLTHVTDKDPVTIAPPLPVVTTTVKRPMQPIDMLELLHGDVLSNAERSYRLIISHLVGTQYRRGAESQQRLRDAVEDVLLNGLKSAESLQTHAGISEHVLDVYVQRCRETLRCFRDSLPHLYESMTVTGVTSPSGAAAAGSITAARPYQRRRSSTAVPPPTTTSTTSVPAASAQLSPCTPTRTSRRLQAKLSVDAAIAALLPDESALVDFLRKLSAINFPLDDRFVIGLAKELSAKQQQQSTTVTTVDDGIWMEWLQHFRNRHGFDD